MSHHGDLGAGTVLDFLFTTVNNAPTTLVGATAAVYKANSAAQSVAGLTLDVDHDGVTGQHHVRVNTAADPSFYAAGADFSVVLTAGTCAGFSVAGSVVGTFSIEARSLVSSAAAILAAIAALPAAVWSAAVRSLTTVATPSGPVFSGPVVDGGLLEIVRGDDYTAEQGNPLQQANTALIGLEVASVLWVFREGKDGELIEVEGEWDEDTGTASCDLTSEQTTALTPGLRNYLVDVRLTLTSPAGQKRTPFTPRMTVREGLY